MHEYGRPSPLPGGGTNSEVWCTLPSSPQDHAEAGAGPEISHTCFATFPALSCISLPYWLFLGVFLKMLLAHKLSSHRLLLGSSVRHPHTPRLGLCWLSSVLCSSEVTQTGFYVRDCVFRTGFRQGSEGQSFGLCRLHAAASAVMEMCRTCFLTHLCVFTLMSVCPSLAFSCWWWLVKSEWVPFSAFTFLGIKWIFEAQNHGEHLGHLPNGPLFFFFFLSYLCLCFNSPWPCQ